MKQVVNAPDISKDDKGVMARDAQTGARRSNGTATTTRGTVSVVVKVGRQWHCWAFRYEAVAAMNMSPGPAYPGA